MDFKNLIADLISIPPAQWQNWVAAEHLSRQEWQVAVETLLVNIRKHYKRPAFGLSEAEISIAYHRPIAMFSTLLTDKLG